uniref:Solute carrier family 2, facilitated glucose transporter member 8 n=1 Tax=Ciona savignyi TaxID=51511 RepID=H2YZ80_CIOSA
LFFYSGIMVLGAVSTGLMLGLSAPIIPKMETDKSPNAIHVDKSEASWIGSLLMLGGMVGGPIAGIFMQHFGRKPTAIASGIPYVGGLLMISFAKNVWMVYAGRVITGVAMAFTSLAVPTYVSEISTKGLRGLLGSGNQLGITLGVFISYAAGWYNKGELPWRTLPLVLAGIPVLFVICCLILPETPQFLCMENKPSEAARALQKIRGKNANINSELEGIQQTLSLSMDSASWIEIVTTSSMRWPLLLSILSMFLQQFSGINCIMFYFHTIFQASRFTTSSQLYMASLLVAGVQVLFTVVSCLLVDRAGRRFLLILSGSVMAISMVTFGLYFQLIITNQFSSKTFTNNLLLIFLLDLNWLALTSMMVYIIAFSLGLGPIPWLLMVELIPLRARAKSSGCVIAFNLLFAFLTTKEFHDLVIATSDQATFWMFGGICVLSVLFVIFLLPETKGRTFEEIERYFQRDQEY